MEFVSLNQKMDDAGKQNIRNTHLFGTDNFRSWMLYFEPGDCTPMHYHQSPETFLVIDGKCAVRESKEKSGSLRKTISSSSPPKTTTSSSTSAPARWSYSAIAPNLSASAQ